MALDNSFQKTALLTGTEPSTVILSPLNRHVEISHSSSDALFIKLAFVSGDTEVSGSNFDIRVPANDRWVWTREHSWDPRFKNARMVCASDASVGIWGY